MVCPVLSVCFNLNSLNSRARGSVVGWGTMLQTGISRVRFHMRSLDFALELILPAALWSSGRLTEMSTSWGWRATGA
jgi:hypothetical protein